MLISSQLVRFAMASGMYLLLMWGYAVLPSAQWFAAFLALIMCAMLVFWVSESAADADYRSRGSQAARVKQTTRQSLTVTDEFVDSAGFPVMDDGSGSLPPSLEASILRLDSLKAELMVQYAQFGRDQSLLNSSGLGFWHGNRKPGTH
ncbi:MAG: hypothetical protein HKN42_19250 [Granulosicoccus sp.]|nr:hypothetical protein [Granulosicoccus sp.]